MFEYHQSGAIFDPINVVVAFIVMRVDPETDRVFGRNADYDLQAFCSVSPS
jgi:hypothetical protein